MGALNEKEPPVEYMVKMFLEDNNDKAFSLIKIAEMIRLCSERGTLSAAISSKALMRILVRMERKGMIKSEPIGSLIYFTLAD